MNRNAIRFEEHFVSANDYPFVHPVEIWDKSSCSQRKLTLIYALIFFFFFSLLISVVRIIIGMRQKKNKRFQKYLSVIYVF